MIWAPADTLASPASYLMISCVQNISRLQLVTAQPIDSRRVKVRLDLRHQVGPAFDVVYQSSGSSRKGNDVLLAPLLTAKGFKEYFEPRSQRFADLAMIDQWALGERSQLDYSDADREALSERLRSLYSADYIDSWRRALNAISVTDLRDLDHGVAVLQQFAGPAAPLHRLLDTVRENTALSSAGAESPAEAQALQPRGSSTEQRQAWAIQRSFAGLSAMLRITGEKPSYYDETLGAIAAVHDYAKAVNDSPERDKAALEADQPPGQETGGSNGTCAAKWRWSWRPELADRSGLFRCRQTPDCIASPAVSLEAGCE